MRLRRLEPAHTAEDVTTARPLSKALTKKMPMKMKNGRVCEKKRLPLHFSSMSATCVL